MTYGLGREGEEIALHFLRENGFEIMGQNFRCALGEIDIIASEGNTLCFIEVKTRRNPRFGLPYEYVDKKKQRKIIRVAKAYLAGKPRQDREMRFDVVSILLPKDGTPPSVELIRNAFSE